MPISPKKSLTNLCEEIKFCKKCLDLSSTRKQPVPGTGAASAKLIIIGYYPSDKGAEIDGIPFTHDQEGMLIRKVLKEVGLSTDKDTFLTYLVKCTPRKLKKDNSRQKPDLIKPLPEHIANCITYLTEEISIITPHLIISLGLSATKIILERFFSIEKNYNDMSRLHMRLFENPSFKLVPFYHPKDVTKGLITEEKYLSDFKTLSRLFTII
ncbi:MAG: uracil-DNA glycosylase [Actinobacteria bacterium]|nr:uracil-DNA glycosylase [Actinomycetota bacterium]